MKLNVYTGDFGSDANSLLRNSPADTEITCKMCRSRKPEHPPKRRSSTGEGSTRDDMPNLHVISVQCICWGVAQKGSRA